MRQRNFFFPQGQSFQSIVLNSIDYFLLCPGNSYSLCKRAEKVRNHGKMLLVLAAAEAERAHLALWCRGGALGMSQARQPGSGCRWSLSHWTALCSGEPGQSCVLQREGHGSYLMLQEASENWKRRETSFLWGRRTQRASLASSRNISCRKL